MYLRQVEWNNELSGEKEPISLNSLYTASINKQVPTSIQYTNKKIDTNRILNYWLANNRGVLKK